MMEMKRLQDAIEVATKYHRGQFRDSGEPYICHCMRVLQNVLDKKKDILSGLLLSFEDICIAAVLHDTLEDTELLAVDIATKFGFDVSDTVRILSRQKDETYASFIDRIKMNEVATIIKLADLKDNMRDAESLLPEKAGIIERYKKAYAKLTK